MTCPYCHPHCTRTEHGSDCVLCECRKTRPIKAAKVKIVPGQRYMLRQGRQIQGRRRVVSGEIVRVEGQAPDGTYSARTYDNILVWNIRPEELGRNK